MTVPQLRRRFVTTVPNMCTKSYISDEWALELFLRELEHQHEAAHLAVSDLNQALAQPTTMSTARAFAAVQSLLAAGAMVSKILWPQPSPTNPDGSPLTDDDEVLRQLTIERGRALRAALGIKAVPVLESRKVRNAFEHFDDRLDQFLADGNRIVLDRNIGPRDSVVVIDGKVPVHLRLIDTQRCSVSVLDNAVSMQELYDAIADVARRASARLADRP